jgi:hypothetical protein
MKSEPLPHAPLSTLQNFTIYFLQTLANTGFYHLLLLTEGKDWYLLFNYKSRKD